MMPIFIATLWPANGDLMRPESRRRYILITIEHIRQQQTELECNASHMDLNALRRRREFFAELLAWYVAKLQQVENALEND